MGQQHLGACPAWARTGWLMWLEPVAPARSRCTHGALAGGTLGTKSGGGSGQEVALSRVSVCEEPVSRHSTRR